MADIRVCFLACFYRTECHTTEPRPCDSIQSAPAPAAATVDSYRQSTTTPKEQR